MAKLSSLLLLKYSKAFGVNSHFEQDPDKNTVIGTVYEKSSALINLASRRVTKDWSLMGRDVLSSPVHYDSQHRAYCVILNNKNLHSWKLEDMQIEKSHKVKVAKPVHRVFNIIENSVILFQDGSYALTENPNSSYGKSVLDHNSNIWSDCCCTAVATYLIFMTSSEEGDETKLGLYTYVFQRSIESACLHEFNIRRSGCKFVSCCCQVKDDEVFLIILWSNGDITRHLVTDATEAMEVLPKIQGLKEGLASVATVDSTQIVVSGIETEAGVSVGIWDVEFGVLQTSTPFPNQTISKTKVHCFKNKIILVSDHGLYIGTFNAPTSSLSNVLGQLKLNSSSKHGSSHRQDQPLIRAAENLVLNPVGPAFVKAFREFHRVVHTDNTLLVNKQISALLAAWSEYDSKNKQFVIPKEEIFFLITNCALQGSHLRMLLPLLMKQNQVFLVNQCVEHIYDIPETCMVDILEFYLRCDENTLNDELKNMDLPISESEEENQISTQRAFLINALVVTPMNDSFLHHHLSRLSFSHAMMILNYLHGLLNGNTYGLDKRSLPNANQVADWLACVLDAHFAQLILSQDARAFLVGLHQTVLQRVQCIEEMNSLEALLIQIKQRYDMPKLKNMGHYCIETLHIY